MSDFKQPPVRRIYISRSDKGANAQWRIVTADEMAMHDTISAKLAQITTAVVMLESDYNELMKHFDDDADPCPGQIVLSYDVYQDLCRRANWSPVP